MSNRIAPALVLAASLRSVADEPKANSNSRVTIAGDASTIDGERVTARSVLAGGIVRIVIEKSRQDDRRPAMFRFTYWEYFEGCLCPEQNEQSGTLRQTW